MFAKHSRDEYHTPMAGIHMKTICYGTRTLMTEFRLDAGNELPVHSHPHEQTGYLVRGHIVLVIDGHEYDATPGDSWCIAPHVEHGARFLENSVAIEVFSPVREDYLPGKTKNT